MTKRGGRRVKIKRLKYLIKQALALNQEPISLIAELDKLLISTSKAKITKQYKLIKIDLPETLNQVYGAKRELNNNYKLRKLDFEVDYPHFKNINKTDPRYKLYKIRYLFGED